MGKVKESRAHPDSIQSGRALSMLACNGGLLCPAGAALRYWDAAAGMGGGLSPKWVADRQPSSGLAHGIRVDALSPGPLTKLSQ
jgi:hypothetical protein